MAAGLAFSWQPVRPRTTTMRILYSVSIVLLMSLIALPMLLWLWLFTTLDAFSPGPEVIRRLGLLYYPWLSALIGASIGRLLRLGRAS
jgi:hypothetical protein